MRKYFRGLSATTFFLAFCSLFADIASEMLYPILPLYLTQTLRAGPRVLGIVEGIAPAMQNIVQGLSGWLSDKLQRRKKLAFAGYLLGAAAKPLIGFAVSWPMVLAARSLDRLGTGMRSAPRDALIAASVDKAHRGKAFGLEGFGDNLGACIGPLITILLLSHFQLNMRSVFFLALIPGLLAVIMILLVHEQPVEISAKAKLDLSLHGFPREYWIYLAITALFGIGNSSNTFLILRTSDLGVSLHSTILIYALFNLVAAFSSYPAGYLSDVLGRKLLLSMALLVSMVVYAGFGFTSNTLFLAVLFGLYGIHHGIYRAVGKALAIDLLPPHLHAGGVGWFNATIGLSGLLASVIGGALWAAIGPSATFLYGAIFALLAVLALPLVRKRAI